MYAQLDDAKRNAYRESALADLFTFARGVLRLDFLDPVLHYPLCLFLQKCPKRALVILPRGFLKTSLIRAYLIWRAVKDSSLRMLYVTNSEPNAKKFIHAIKDVFERNDFFQLLFPEVIPDFAHTRWSDLAAEINREVIGFPEATFEGAGVGTTIVSRHYNIIVEDDTLAPKKDDISGEELMPMRDEIDKVIGWHKMGEPLLINPPACERLVFGTRWTYGDLIQDIMERPTSGNELDWQVFERACRDAEGQPTYPKRFPESTLQGIERDIGPYLFNALYLNNPISGDKQVFKRDWLIDSMYERAPSNLRIFMACDAAYSFEGKADFTGIVVGGVTDDAHLYILDYIKARLYPKEIVEAIFTLARAHPELERLALEAVAAQVALLYDIQDKMSETGLIFTVDAIKRRERTKHARIGRLQPLASNGRFHLKATHTELLQELLTFPFREGHDDLVDAASDLVPYIGLPASVSVEELPCEARRWQPDTQGHLAVRLDEVLEELAESRRGGHFDMQVPRLSDGINWLGQEG